ncbi:inorganic pyrophosphatase family protein [Trichomonas vaginalis G3]|uniref:inorganic diphosphatase n=1 Tax=Trichomonas vaginalis (strain ATCC PRA-98 / G3) TaxID=412133 RepID=A2DX41_TRIV3|nr:inorganic diphosphatase protein [Trichomonas vaginalis G3]EAY15068.1 inorganic pyrophosphatase family protein [Trichomonas vaginalis G3]KAI5549634.1 inorganic diphosphatase protein [Trichomonas vaginalis G3]|eukprot:XP_001327291.1 inorganic pyrophosphatase family protein [Trichomonas vaginalis G3]
MALVSRSERGTFNGGIYMPGHEEDCRAYTEALIDKVNDEQNNEKVKYERKLFQAHPLHGVSIGKDYPDIVAAVIEIPAGSRVKTELDIATGLLCVDRILHSSTVYPANYGFIPETLAGDTNPLDIVVLSSIAVPARSIMHARPIGIVGMTNNGKIDEKVIAVSIGDPEYNFYTDITQLPPFKLIMINQFFIDYKKLERANVIVQKPKSADVAKRVVTQWHENYLKTYNLLDSTEKK